MTQNQTQEKPILGKWKNFYNHHIPQEKTILDQRRQHLTAWYVVLLILGILADLLEVSGSFDIFYKYTNSVMLALTLLWTGRYIAMKTSITRTMALLSGNTQLFIATDTVYCALSPSVPHTQMVILVNMLILAGNIMFSIATFQRAITLFNVAIAVATFYSCMIFSDNYEFQQYFTMVVLLFTFTGILGLHIAHNTRQLQSDYESIKEEEEELMRVLQLNKEQLKLYIELSKREYKEDETRLILAKFSEKTQKYVVDNVTKYIQGEKYNDERIKEQFPELSPSEREIVHLILRGHKLGSICTMLNKSESNINTQRANIRRKLALHPTDNLNKALESRMSTPTK